MFHRLAVCSLVLGCSHPAPTPVPPTTEKLDDPTSHKRTTVEVAPGVSLEVLDYGGTGQPLVFLAGLGNTAHIFDDFAPALADRFHVYAVTRRGFPGSSAPDTGYDIPTRAADDLAVLDGLKLPRAIVAGHSIAGDELTELAANHSDRVRAVIYLDASHDHARVREMLAQTPPPQVDPPPDVLTSWKKFLDWQDHDVGIHIPRGEHAAQLDLAPDGSVKGMKGGAAAPKILEAVTKLDVTRVGVPALVFLATEPKLEKFFGYARLTPPQREAMQKLFTNIVALIEVARSEAKMFPAGHVVEIAGAHHYIFISHRQRVLDEIRAFAAGLK